MDLVYLDPPLNSKKSYNLLFEHRDGKKVSSQIKAFDDSWEWGQESAETYHNVVSFGGKPASMLRGIAANARARSVV